MTPDRPTPLTDALLLKINEGRRYINDGPAADLARHNEDMAMKEVKTGDVFRFRYTDGKDRFMPDHCFDGQLIATVRNGNILLVDTYWGLENNSNKIFSLEKAQDEGALTFVCNMNEVEKVEKYNLHYYAESDKFDLSYQHGCYQYFARRIGSKKDREAMTNYLHAEMKRAKDDLDQNVRRLEQLSRSLQVVEDNNDLETVFI